MGKPIEQHLADYLLGMNPMSRTRSFMRSNLAFIKDKYGEQIANRVRELVRGKWRA